MTLPATSAATGADPQRDSRSHDFDFLFGEWRVQHRRLKERLAGCEAWERFAGTCRAQPVLGGLANIDDNWLDLPGGPYRAASLRAFDLASGNWAIWWLDGRWPRQLDVPVVGGFKDGVGTFLADDEFAGRRVTIRFLWSHITAHSCRWQQAFSPDGEVSWETNWFMDFARAT